MKARKKSSTKINLSEHEGMSALYESLRAKGRSQAAAMRVVRASLAMQNRSAQATILPDGADAPEKISAKFSGNGMDHNAITKKIATVIDHAQRKGEGYRIGVIGETGAGKTSVIRAILRAPWNGITLIHDEKPGKATQFMGTAGKIVLSDRVDIEAITRVAPDANVVIFRGDPIKGTRTGADDVARLARRLGSRGVPVRAVFDELDSACTDGGMRLSSEPVRWCLTQGRAVNVSVICSTQLPQRMPTEVLDNLSILVSGRCGPRSQVYLRNRAFFEDGMIDAIGKLRAHYGQHGGTGELVVWEPGERWDAVVYANQ